jgi:mannonate dehydratase
MRLALTVNAWNDEDLLFAEQFGVTHLLAAPVAPAGQAWDAARIAAMRNRIQKAGFQFAGLDGLPQSLDALVKRVLMGETGEESLADVSDFIVRAGEAGVPLIRYDLGGPAPDLERRPEGRGRAQVRRLAPVDDGPADGVPADGAQWERAAAAARRVASAAESAGVRMACRPGRPFSRPDAWQRLIDAAPSPAHGLDFSRGDLLRWPDADPVEAIHHFGRQGRIFLAEEANWKRDASGLAEAFLDEPAPADEAHPGALLLQSLRAYREIGFDGAIRPAPPPGIAGDTAWGHIGQAFHAGYLRAWLQALERA